MEDERLPDEQDFGPAEAHKQTLLDLCSRDHLALASMVLLLQGFASQKNLSALSPEALGPLQELCSSESARKCSGACHGCRFHAAHHGAGQGSLNSSKLCAKTLP